MIYKTSVLSEKYPDASYTAYISDDDAKLKMPPRPVIIVCPGGGYHNLSPREAEPIAKRFFGAGFNVFLLTYSLGKDGASGFAPLIELSMLIKYIRENNEGYNIDRNRIFVIGFSAGGHLAASAGILWNSDVVRNALGICEQNTVINRPDGMLLCYPVITSGSFAHKNSFVNLCGHDNPTDEEMRAFSLECFVDRTTSPTFIWHTVTDTTVPVQNTLLLVNALIENGVSVESHIYPYGRHGLALSDKETWSQNPERLVPHNDSWFELALRWISDYEYLPKIY